MSNRYLFQKGKDLEVSNGQIRLFGSAPIEIRGFKECSDIDLIVVEELWQKYKNRSGWEYKITENGVGTHRK